MHRVGSLIVLVALALPPPAFSAGLLKPPAKVWKRIGVVIERGGRHYHAMLRETASVDLVYRLFAEGHQCALPNDPKGYHLKFDYFGTVSPPPRKVSRKYRPFETIPTAEQKAAGAPSFTGFLTREDKQWVAYVTQHGIRTQTRRITLSGRGPGLPLETTFDDGLRMIGPYRTIDGSASLGVARNDSTAVLSAASHTGGAVQIKILPEHLRSAGSGGDYAWYVEANRDGSGIMRWNAPAGHIAPELVSFENLEKLRTQLADLGATDQVIADVLRTHDIAVQLLLRPKN